MIENKHYLCVFKSRSHTVLIFTLFEEEGKEYFQLISTPCSLQTGCGYAIRFFHKGYIDVILKEVHEYNLPMPRFYRGERFQGNIQYKELQV